MKVKQLSVFLENKPGALSRPIQLLAGAKLNILTLSLADTKEFGILRLILQDWETAKTLLEREGFVVNVNDVVVLEVNDAPGRLADILTVTEKSRVNLEYMYGFTLQRGGKGVLAFRFSDPDKAIETLKQRGISPVANVDLFSLMS